MKDFLKQNFIEKNYHNFENQPEGLKKIICDNLDESLSGKIEFIDYFGEPLVYSKKDLSFYIYSDGELKLTGDKSENDLERLSLEEFNLRFNGLGDILSSEFQNKASINNELELLLDESRLEKYVTFLLENNPDNQKIIAFLENIKNQNIGEYYKDGITSYSYKLFLAIKGLENGLSTQDIISLVGDKNDDFSELYILTELYFSIFSISNEDLLTKIKSLNLDNFKYGSDDFKKLFEYIENNSFGNSHFLKSRLEDIIQIQNIKKDM